MNKFNTIRWQIELIFKNWKSNFDLDEVTGERPQRIKCMLYAKLLFIFLTHKVIQVARSLAWSQLAREVSEFQATKQIKIIGHEWLRAIIQEPEKVEFILSKTISWSKTMSKINLTLPILMIVNGLFFISNIYVLADQVVA